MSSETLQNLKRQGRWQEVLQTAQILVRENPQDGEAWFSLGLGLYMQKRLGDAEVAFSRAVSLRQDRPDYWLNYGLCLHAQGRIRAASKHYERALSLDERYGLAHFHLARSFLQREKPHDAIYHAEKAVAFVPTFQPAQEILEALTSAAPAQNQGLQNQASSQSKPLATNVNREFEQQRELGLALFHDDKFREAALIFQKVLDKKTDDYEIKNLFAACLFELGDRDEAIDLFRDLTFEFPWFIKGKENLVSALAQEGYDDEVAPLCHELMQENPEECKYKAWLGHTYLQKKDPDAALTWIDRYLECEQGEPDEIVLGDLAECYLLKQDYQTSAKYLCQSLTKYPESFHARFNLSWLFLMMGQWEAGWQAYLSRENELKIKLAELGYRIEQSLPSSLAGKRVMVFGEQGIGDELFFLRYVVKLTELGAKVHYLYANEKLRPLLEKIPWFDEIGHLEQVYPSFPWDYDHYFAVGDLPSLLYGVFDTPVPASISLAASASVRDTLQARLKSLGPGPYIGITWKAGKDVIKRRGWDPKALYKEAPYLEIADILRQVPGTVISLQRNPLAEDVRDITHALGRKVHDFSQYNDDLPGMLGLLDLLDDYIAVSNTNVYLRTALGKGGRVFVTSPPEWRWGESGRASVWFPGFTVYRQAADLSWQDDLDALRQDLTVTQRQGED